MSDQQNDQGSDKIFAQISELSRQFRKQIAQGDAPQIERFLTQLGDSGKENLFTSLLDVELRFRQREGEFRSLQK